MARKRMIDPSIWISEDFGVLSDLAQIYFIGIISNADDEGRLKVSAPYLKATIRPYASDTIEQVEEIKKEIAARDMVVMYQSNGVEYGYLPTWKDYQKINRPQESKIPEPPPLTIENSTPSNTLTDHSLNDHEQNTNNSAPIEVKRKEVKGSEEKEPEPHLSLPEKNLSLDDDTPTNRWLKTFQNQRPGAGHPLANLNVTEIEDVRGRVADLITKQGEVQAIELLNQVFADKDRPRPTSVKQAVLFCNQKLEKAKKENSNVDADGYVTTGAGNGDSWLYSEDD